MSKTIERIEKMTLPVIALRGSVVFPSVPISFEIPDEASIHAAEAAFETGSPILVCPWEPSEDHPDDMEVGEFFHVGTVARIKQSIHTPEGNVRLMVEGFSRASVLEMHRFADYLSADVIVKTVALTDDAHIRSKAYCRAILDDAAALASLRPSGSEDVLATAKTVKNPGLLADFIASHLLSRYEDKCEILSCFDPIRRIETLLALLKKEAELLELELQIHSKVRSRLNRNQKEYYLREQIHTIQEELGETNEIDEYQERILKTPMPDEVRQKLLKENERMAKTPFGSSEATVMRSYLDVCLDIPWSVQTKDRVDIAAAKKILDADHDGLDKVKERILEFLAVKQLNPALGNQILCLVGPPGVGKTSVGASIARAMKRKYVRVSLGGVRDEADIRGHRKTYIGAMPGRIIQGLIQAKVNNSLILLDEIDKVTRDAHGDPASALLEVLDGEQNKAFRDHFVELPFDLSNCLFIATANTLDTIPKPLLDRMEILELSTYTRQEKLSIAKHHLIPKQRKRHGLSARMLSISDGAVTELVDYYTREAGVRNLERAIADLCRKTAKRLLENPDQKSVKVTERNLAEFLGPRKRLPETISDRDEVGVVNGLAYTQVGGDLLRVEVAVLEGTGKLELTGSLGDVMKESAKIAVSYVRSIAKEYGIAPDFYQTKDLHIHFPEGAIPKDGPSAGVTMVTALVSALSGRAVRRDIAMTGEISLRGNVLAIGGLKEKTMAAYAAGVHTVLLPEENMVNLEDLDPMVRRELHFLPCRRVSEVLKYALVPPRSEAAAKPDPTAAAELPSVIPSQGDPRPQPTVR